MSVKLGVLTAAVLLAFAGAIAPGGAAAKPKVYKNCAALNAKYPHGVGNKGARDSSPDPVTNFLRNTALYNANKSRDRDRDGVACEKK